MQILPYLFLDGRCEEAIEFYRTALGAEVQLLMRYRDCPDAGEQAKMPTETLEKVMHASLRIGSTWLLLSDGHCHGRPEFKGFSLSLTAADEAEADRAFAALGDGGEVRMPLTKTFFSPRFGMVSDRFGVNWMLLVEH